MPKGYKFARWARLSIAKGQAVHADDPMVRDFPDMWSDEPTVVASSVPRSFTAAVEQATAAPGEKRA